MNKLYSGRFCFLQKRLKPLGRRQLFSPKVLQYRSCYLFNSQNQQDKPQNEEQYIISDEELTDSQLFRKKSFFERNKLTLGLFGAGVLSNVAGFHIIAAMFYGSSFISLSRAEKYFLKLRKLYEDVYGINAQKYENLNTLLKETMLKNEELKKFIRKDTLCFSNMMLTRKSHAENRLVHTSSYEAVQKRYHYGLLFFDIGTGAEGRISSQCVYNYDKDYYFRLIYVYLIKPKPMVIKIEDKRDTIDI